MAEQAKTKRDNGSGYIYQRDNGSWVGRVFQTADENGKQKYKYFSGKTQGEVKRKIRDWQQQGAKVATGKVILKDYLMNWLKTYKFNNVKQSSYDALENTAKNHVIPALGCLQMQSVAAKDIQEFLNGMKERGLSYSMVKKGYDLLNAMFKKATIDDVVIKNPMLTVEKPSSVLFEEKEIRVFTQEECALITEECSREYKNGKKVYQYADAYILILHTGLRMGEAIGLEKTDWDKQESSMHVRRNLQSVKKRDAKGNALRGKELVTNTTKTYSGKRDIPLNKVATEATERLCAAHPDSPWIICDSNGNRIPPERLERTFYRLLDNLKIDRTGVHTLRHTFASMLFEKGRKVTEVSELLGHASVSITLNTYIHLIKKLDHSSVEVLEDI